MLKKNYQKCLLAILTYNNGKNLKKTLSKIKIKFPIDILVNIDGSTDNSEKYLKGFKIKILKSDINYGIGFSIKKIIKYAKQKNYKFVVIVSANNKNNVNQSINLFKKLMSGFDYVQGSRYLKGSRRDNTPLFRLIMVKLHAYMFTVITGKKCTDALEGFRGYNLNIFKNKNININQDWLDKYEFETYLHYKVLKHNLKYTEVPVSKIYPKNKKSIINIKGEKYTNIRPIIDWWKILRPIPYLMLGIKK